MAQLLILGHSIIAHLMSFCGLEKNKCSKDIQGVRTDFRGVRGATTDTILRIIKGKIIPTIRHVLLQIEGNDLRDDNYIEVANKIEINCRELIQKGIKKVMVVGILPRDKPRGMSSNKYRIQRQNINKLLAARFKDQEGIVYCPCQTFRTAYFAKDKTHLNQYGNKWLYKLYYIIVKKHVLNPSK